MKNMFKRILCLLLALLMLSTLFGMLAFAAATTADQFKDNTQVKDYQSKIDALEKEQQELKNQLKNVQNQRYTAQQQANDLRNLILSTEELIETTNLLLSDLGTQIAAKQAVIDDLNSKIETKQSEMALTKDKFMQLLRIQYEHGEPSLIEVIYDADGISDMLSRAQYMGSIMQYTSDLLDKYTSENEELNLVKNAQEAALANLEADREVQLAYADTLNKKKSDLEEQKGDKDTYIASLRMSEAEIQREYEAAQKAEEEENARLEKLLRELANESNSEYIGGKFIWPVDRSIKRISSYYGWRTYYYKGKKVTDFHMGIDIPAPQGTDIYAVQSGTVILAQSHSSYGNYMIVDHGGGITTLYAHCYKLLKKKGDKVTQGDHIAEMGTTGNSTGPHLHIEVRVNGKHEDPIANGWLVQPK